MQETLVSIFSAGRITALVQGDAGLASVFGGPLELPVEGAPTDPLHHIATLTSSEFAGDALQSISLPLIYGLTFGGCALE
jgi:hypothetical protein